MNDIQLRYKEHIFYVRYKRVDYLFTLIEDCEIGDTEVTVMRYNKKGELVIPTDKQRQSVIDYFNNTIIIS